jgi:predicted short-subunit dehydrogenase-like oxidoreductase (DUF2520 family)
MKSKITFIGSGNIATNLAHALDSAGHTINQVISRDIAHAKILASKFGAYYGDKPSEMYKDSDFVILCVSDEAYFSVLEELPREMKAIICHTAGPVGMDILANYSVDYGVFYPLQSFRKEEVKDMLQVPMFIEWSSDMVKQKLHNLADSISNKVREVNSVEREKYHLAAVFANNFTNAMYAVADEYLTTNGLEFNNLLPIIKETADRLKKGKPNQWQTGPAKRGDKAVLEKHLSMLDDEQLKSIYTQMSHFISQNTHS